MVANDHYVKKVGKKGLFKKSLLAEKFLRNNNPQLFVGVSS